MIGSYPIGVFAVGSPASDVVFSEDVLIASHITTNYPSQLNSGTSNMEVDAFKDTTSAGACLEAFNGRLYFAINNYVYCTKAMNIENVDVRKMVVAGFPGNVTGIGRVNDGLYIGTATDTYFLKGTSPIPEEGGFEQTHIAKFGMIPGTLVRFQSDLVPEAKSKDTTVLWTNSLGVFAGSDGGSYSCLSLNQITLPVGSQGAAMVTEGNGIYQYVVCFDTTADSFINIADAITVNPLTTQDTIVVNLITGAHSRYSNYAFNSFFKRDDRYYGANATGIYLLEGDKDFAGQANINIDAWAVTPITDFEEECNKAVDDAFINARSNDDIAIDITIDETSTYADFVTSYNDQAGIQRRRIKLPTGLEGNSWQFKVKNTNGAYFKLFDFEVMAAKLARKI